MRGRTDAIGPLVALAEDTADELPDGRRARTSDRQQRRASPRHVRKAIATALDAIHAADPVVARHLTMRVRTGGRCCYEPDPDTPSTWRL